MRHGRFLGSLCGRHAAVLPQSGRGAIAAVVHVPTLAT
ncbi:hypothetical protein T261_3897 [Streptomyces lydicus]|nr:hypothetical protein T261_3897 [Streptomyces lydicus]